MHLIISLLVLTLCILILLRILPPSIVLTYDIAASLFVTAYTPIHFMTRITCFLLAVAWDTFIFCATYVLLLTLLVEIDSL